MGQSCTSENSVIRASTASLRDDVVPVKILILGPSSSGKTYLLYSWLLGVDGLHSTKATEEFNVEKVQTKSGTSFSMWDLSGNPTFNHHRKRKFFEGTQGVIFVCDTSENLKLAKKDLKLVLQEHPLQHVPLLLVANKFDEQEWPSDDVLLTKLGVGEAHKLGSRQWILSKVRLRCQEDVDQTLMDLHRLVTM